MIAMKSMNICNDKINYDEIIIQRFLFEVYSRRTSNYSKTITLYDPTYIMSIAIMMAIDMKTPLINS